MQQLSQGDLIGIKATPSEDETSDYALQIGSVVPGSIAADLNLEVGDEVNLRFPDSRLIEFRLVNPDVEFEEGKQLAILVDSKQQGRLVLPVDQLPTRSRGTHPTQIYSSINAGLLCLVLWFFWTVKSANADPLLDRKILDGADPSRRTGAVRNRLYDFSMGKCLGNRRGFFTFCDGTFPGRWAKLRSASSSGCLTIVWAK